MSMREQPCPYRIVDDFGNGFSMGCAAGVILYFIRGMWYAPKKEKFIGGILLLKKRAPILGGTCVLT
jgi:import inner membrane translocase subunit TIM17